MFARFFVGLLIDRGTKNTYKSYMFCLELPIRPPLQTTRISLFSSRKTTTRNFDITLKALTSSSTSRPSLSKSLRIWTDVFFPSSSPFHFLLNHSGARTQTFAILRYIFLQQSQIKYGPKLSTIASISVSFPFLTGSERPKGVNHGSLVCLFLPPGDIMGTILLIRSSVTPGRRQTCSLSGVLPYRQKYPYAILHGSVFLPVLYHIVFQEIEIHVRHRSFLSSRSPNSQAVRLI